MVMMELMVLTERWLPIRIQMRLLLAALAEAEAEAEALAALYVYGYQEITTAELCARREATAVMAAMSWARAC